MATSLLKTLAGKHQTRVRKEAKRLQGTTQTPEGPRTCLKLTIPREGKSPLVATFGGQSLKRVQHPVIKDLVITPYPRMRSEIIERLFHDTCDVCGSKEHIEMHHIRKLADLHKEGRREKPLWMKIMISRKRKSIPPAADVMTTSIPIGQSQRNKETGEPDDATSIQSGSAGWEKRPAMDLARSLPSFNVLGVLFLGEVSSAFLPSKKASWTPKFRHLGVDQQYPPVSSTG